LEDQVVDNIMLRSILKKYGVNVWTGFHLRKQGIDGV